MRKLIGVAVFSAALITFGACGGSSSDTGTATDGGDGTSCAEPAVSCGSCSAVCSNGKWSCPPCAQTVPTDSGSGGNDTGAGDAETDGSLPGLSCGALTCIADQYCQVGHHPFHPPPSDGGPTSSTSYDCKDLPSACTATPTCQCLSMNGVSDSCSAGANGLTVTINYP